MALELRVSSLMMVGASKMEERRGRGRVVLFQAKFTCQLLFQSLF